MPKRSTTRAASIAPKITPEVVALAKGMLARGDRQSDIAAYFQFNQGRLWEIRQAAKYRHIVPAEVGLLPEPGPYVVVAKVRHERATIAEGTLTRILSVLAQAAAEVKQIGSGTVEDVYWLGLAHGKLHELERPRREHEERERAKADKEDRPWKVKAP